MAERPLSSVIQISYVIAILVVLELIVSSSRVGYYLIKAVSEDSKWLSLNEHEKRKLYYGPLYETFETAKEIETNSFALISSDGKAYFLGRYLLYPQKIYWEKNREKILELLKRERYALVINPADETEIELMLKMGYKRAEEFSFSDGSRVYIRQP